ncbi:MAG: Flp pilus assembly complex ATPase component TadA [Sedimentisphaerales bacterium]|nr:Flp pilus assembly complex ATPase component TadA [Sedimentisphaerales bacterium]
MAKSIEISKTKKKNEIVPLNAPQPDPFNSIVWNAIYENATDIHLNAVDRGILILYRVDGIIHEKRLLSENEGRQLMNQVKTAAKLNATKSFIPQEGQIKWPDEDILRDIRVTVVPAGKNAESAHMRILSFPQEGWSTSKLGFSEEDLESISSAINSMNGLILISGATGSGKTSTMYSFASLTDLRTKMAFSIEDPVEFNLPYAQQIEADERHGLTMYQGLQTILRMDPDLVMVGEIRDRDSAIVTSRAALSGKLVLATIHAKDAAGTVDALHYLGVPYYIIGGSVKLIVAQNLMRRLCQKCAEERTPSKEEKELFIEANLEAPEKIFDAKGCKACNSYGYQGLVAIFEIAKIDPDTAHLITDGIHQQQLRDHFRKIEINSMMVDGLIKVAQGITSIDELYRVCDFKAKD